jgi:hypothetical protein
MSSRFTVEQVPEVPTAVVTTNGRQPQSNDHRGSEGHNGAERTPLFDKNDASLALYEEEYNTQGQKIGQMLRSLSLYASVLPTADDAESTTAAAAPRSNQSQARKTNFFSSSKNK